MKKILSVVLLVSMLVSLFVTTGYASENKIEISFCVGDDTLAINGQDVKVEKPYVVGDGVTLVPLRVITEAFGAKVGWEDSTKTITLSYPGVEIILQIGNLIAEVNKKAVTLLAAPELPGSSTMVPLRFISETFGAVVGYDEKTERITVTKETVSKEGSTVQGTIDAKKIGDSYYGWSISNPVDMTMSDRSFDGSYTEFLYDDDNGFSVTILKKETDYTFDRYFIDTKDDLSDYTLVKADKNTSSENKKTIHFQAKSKTYFIELFFIDSGEYVYEIEGVCNLEQKQYISNVSGIISSFDATFNKEDTYDLSTVKDNMRTYKSEALNISFDVPVDFYMSESGSTNEVNFYKSDIEDNTSHIFFGVYSISQAGTAEQLANKDMNRKKDNYNREISNFSDYVKQRNYAGISSYEYDCEVKSIYNYHLRDVFFQLGDYVYNIAVTIRKPDINTDIYIDCIINSIKAQPIDSEETGLLMRNEPEYEGEYTLKGNNWTMTLPNSCEYVKENDSIIIQDRTNGSVIAISEERTSVKNSRDLKKPLEDFLYSAVGRGGRVTSEIKSSFVGKIVCIDAEYILKDDENSMQQKIILGIYGGKQYAMSITIAELYYSQDLMNKYIQMLKTITFE